MYRHLSPKAALKDKQEPINKIKPSQYPQQAFIIPKQTSKQFQLKVPQRKEKQIKNLNNFFSNNQLPSSPSPNYISTTPPSNLTKFDNSSQVAKNTNHKTGSVFDDYYEKKPNQPAAKLKKQEISLSGDSCQSEGYVALKKGNNPKSIAEKVPAKQKNLVATPFLNNQQYRNGYKSPGNRPPLRSDSQDQTSVKRILSFGGKKIVAGRFLEDNEYKNKGNQVQKKDFKTPCSPQVAPKTAYFPGLNLSDQKKVKQIGKQNTSNDEKGVKQKSSRNIPKFIVNSNIKSSPYLNKFALDSSNENSCQKNNNKLTDKVKIQPLLSQLRKEKQTKNNQQQKSSSFNKGEMFSNLKKRQEKHSLLYKQMNILGVKVQLKVLTADGERPFDVVLIKKINQSKHTVIFLAYHQKTCSLYCLKRMGLLQLKKSGFKQAIREHKFHQYCNHPHIVRCFSTAWDANHLYLIMQFMEEATLGQELRQQVLKNMSQQSTAKTKINQSVTSQITKINKIRRILFEVITAVSYLHQKNIVHRDIKPDNIFVSHNTYKLGDFGSANFGGILEYVGTLDYAAPQILTQSSYDQKVDIWSLGCIAYQLDVGRPPFFHINQEQTKRLTTTGDFDKTLISDPQLRGIIERMLTTNRKNRFSAKELLKNQFFQGLEDGSAYF